MTLTFRHVLCALARCARYDEKSDLIFDPNYDEIAGEAGCCKRTAIRAVAVAEEIGVLRKARHSDGRVSNAFDLLLPNAASNGERPKRRLKKRRRFSVQR
jgi:hypothetical protein